MKQIDQYINKVEMQLVVFDSPDLVLKRTHVLLLALNSPGTLALLNLETLRDLEEVGHVGVVPGQEDGPVLAGQRVHVDEVGHDVGEVEDTTGSLQGFPTVDIKRGQLVGSLYHVNSGFSVWN